MGHRKSECHHNVNDRMKDNIAVLAQTMSLFDQKKDDASQSEDVQYNEEGDNESYAELGFLVINVAGGDNGESNRVERCQKIHITQRVPVEDSILTVAMTGRRGALLLAIMHVISYHTKSRLRLQ